MIDKLATKDCVLCGSCVDACPVSAITYERAYLDFCYPKVDPDKCISCGLCEKACPVLSGETPVREKPRAYAAKNPDGEIRRGSSSGGVFWALAKTMLSRGGYVCGAVFDEEFRVRHMLSNREEEVRRMMGSKYSQSDLTGIHKQIRELLRAGEQVLFTGCPCQVAGIRSFLGREYQNLITADVICHGVPSSTMLRAYLDHQEKKHGSKVGTLCFRDKKHGWHRSSVRLVFCNGAEYCEPITVDAYMKGFLGGIYLKESCYDCRFKEFRSGSDLTLGDFWGAEAVCPERDDNTGLSAVTANSERGNDFFQQCGIDLWEEQVETFVRYNRNLMTPTKRNPNREAFYDYAQARGYSAAIKDQLSEHLQKKICRKGKYWLRCMWCWVRGRKKPLY